MFTRRTEAATEVYERLAIQVAKCTAREAPEASSTARRRGERLVHEACTSPAAKGATQRAARPIAIERHGKSGRRRQTRSAPNRRIRHEDGQGEGDVGRRHPRARTHRGGGIQCCRRDDPDGRRHLARGCPCRRRAHPRCSTAARSRAGTSWPRPSVWREHEVAPCRSGYPGARRRERARPVAAPGCAGRPRARRRTSRPRWREGSARRPRRPPRVPAGGAPRRPAPAPASGSTGGLASARPSSRRVAASGRASDRGRELHAQASRGSRCGGGSRPSARWPQTKRTRLPPLCRSRPRTITTPTSAVDAGVRPAAGLHVEPRRLHEAHRVARLLGWRHAEGERLRRD